MRFTTETRRARRRELQIADCREFGIVRFAIALSFCVFSLCALCVSVVNFVFVEVRAAEPVVVPVEGEPLAAELVGVGGWSG